jgi:DNA-binding transcriptional LysR family regulator
MLRRFDLAMSGYAAAVLLVPLLRALAVRAPDVDLQVLRCDDSERAARNGEIAAGIGAFHHTVDGLRRRVLFSDEFVCAARIGHPGFMAPLDSSRFVQFDHVLVSPRGKPGSQVDTRLRGLGLTRRVRLVTQSFELALQAVADSDMVITVPKRLVQARRDRLVATSLPFSMPSFTVSMIFGDIYLTDPAQRWLRDLIGKIALDADSGHQSNS